MCWSLLSHNIPSRLITLPLPFLGTKIHVAYHNLSLWGIVNLGGPLAAASQDLESAGAAVLLSFCVPLSRGEWWGGSPSSGKDLWKELLRGGADSHHARQPSACIGHGLLRPPRLAPAGRHRGYRDGEEGSLIGLQTTAYVNAALYYEDNVEPDIIKF
jgi:hypothetical protein